MASKRKENRKDIKMGQIVAKIVLTGGPCAGKTTALSRIEQELHDMGYRVFVVGESATELIKGGIRPFGEKKFSMIDFQRFILQYQREKEQIYERAISFLPEEEQCVLLYDRGLLDNKAYITDKEFQEIVKEQGCSELDMLDSYDMVLHLVTAADGCPEFYTLENNGARSESVEEAIRLDQRTQHAWTGHNRLVIIDNTTDFETKINRALENIYQVVHRPYQIRYQKKYLVDISSSDFSFCQENGVRIRMEQTYLEHLGSCEMRVRKRTKEGESTYYLTVQKKDPDGLSKIVTDKKITEKEYARLLEGKVLGRIQKERITFIYQKQYFKLDIVQDKSFALLEVNPLSSQSEITFPEGLKIEREVTNETDFDNATLACQTSPSIGNHKKVYKNRLGL